jgi:4-amino-4-deoxy-L-arabinose transferase-like glycosyltransferase
MRHRLLYLLASTWFIAAVAVLVRVLYLVSRVHLIPADVLAAAPFENEVGNVAAALAQGKGFCCVFRQLTGPTAWVAPVYPLLVAGIFKVFGTFTLAAFYSAALLNCIFSALVCFPLHSAATRVAGRSSAILATWLWAFLPNGVIIPYAWIWDTSLSAFLAALLLWLTLRLEASGNIRDYIAYGLCWALAVLTNPSLGAVFPVLLGWLLFRDSAEPTRKLKCASTVLAVIFLCCLPWTVRNYLQFHRFIPLRSNFAFEFWSGNNEIFDEHSRAVNRITRFEQTHLYATLGENAFFDDKWRKAEAFVRANPRLYAGLCRRRVVASWLGTESPWQDFRETDSSLARLLIFCNALALLGMLGGLLWLFRQHSWYLFPVASFPLVFPLAFYFAHTSLRHRHPCDPVVAVLMAIAVIRPTQAQK